jgi:azurin
MFREIMTRRRVLLTLTGVGGTALFVGLLATRDSSAPESITPTATNTAEPTAEPTVEPTEEPTAELPIVTLDIACAGDELAFSPSDLSAAANVQIRLTFDNVSTYFDHNWVLVDSDAVVDAVPKDAAQAGEDQGFLPQDLTHVIAYTPVVASGESATVTFAAPPPGTYPFFCAFPGHALAGMRGTLAIKA